MSDKIHEIISSLRTIPKKPKNMQGIHLGENLAKRVDLFRSHTGVPVSKLVRKLLEDFLDQYDVEFQEKLNQAAVWNDKEDTK